MLSGKVPIKLSGAWQLMLLGDGSPTRHLSLLTGEDVKIELIGMDLDLHPDKKAPKEINELQPPLLRRQVWLQCGSQTLAWAESWWNKQEAEHHMKNKNQPIWQSLTKGRSELFREVDGLAYEEDSAALSLMATLLEKSDFDVVSYGTEAGLYQAAGMPAVVWGPGDIEVAHKPDEFVQISDLETCLSVLERLGQEVLTKTD